MPSSSRWFRTCWLFLAAIALLASGLPAHAAAPSVSTLASRVDQHYNHLRSLGVEFVQTYQGMGMNKRQSGALLLKKPSYMRWTYTDPNGKLYILNHKYGYFYTPGQTEAQRVPAKQIDNLQSPLGFLLGHTNLERELKGLHITTQQDDTYTLEGTPRRSGTQIANLSLTVTAEGIIRSIRITEKDGVVNEFQFSGEADNVPAPASVFEFTPPPGVAVVDGSSPLQ